MSNLTKVEDSWRLFGESIKDFGEGVKNTQKTRPIMKTIGLKFKKEVSLWISKKMKR